MKGIVNHINLIPIGSEVPAHTSGPIGYNDVGDPNVVAEPGDTPGPLGHNDMGSPNRILFRCSTAARLLTLECFPVYYPHGYSRDGSSLGRGETTVVIWFGNSFLNPRPEGRDHDAIDIMTPIGLPVCLTSRQTVVNEWVVNGIRRSGVSRAVSGGRGGNSVRTIDSAGYIHYYAHLRDAPLVTSGTTYNAGHLIGYSGNTGAARSNAHLHYQIRRARQGRGRYIMEVDVEGEVRAFNTRGGERVNPYCELVRLCLGLTTPGVRRGRNSSQYELPIPSVTNL